MTDDPQSQRLLLFVLFSVLFLFSRLKKKKKTKKLEYLGAQQHVITNVTKLAKVEIRSQWIDRSV